MSGRAATTSIIPGRAALSVNNPGTNPPYGWVWTPLLDVAELGTGHTPSRQHPEYWDGDIPWIGIRDARAHHGGVIKETIQTVTELGLANSAARLLPKDTVCLSRTASVGYVVVMGRCMATSQDFVTWTCRDALDPFFLARAIQAEGEDIRNFGEGTTHTTIYFPEVKALHLCLPPLPEQRRIVAKLDQLSARSRAARHHLARTAALAARAKQAILAAAFRGDLTSEWRGRFPDEAADTEALQERRGAYLRQRRGSRLLSDSGLKLSDLGALPHGWFPAHLAEIAETTLGYAFKSSWFTAGGTRLVRGANVAPGRIDWDDTKFLDAEQAEDFNEYRLDVGDIVIAMDRPLISSGFKVAVVDHDAAGALLVQRVARLRALPEADQRYLWWLVNRQTFIEHVIGRATGGDLPHISGNDILTAPVPVPSLREQREIVRRIETAFARIDRLAAEAARAAHLLDRLDERLLAKAFRGELVPQDPADEPAAHLLARIRAARADAPKARRGRAREGVA